MKTNPKTEPIIGRFVPTYVIASKNKLWIRSIFVKIRWILQPFQLKKSPDRVGFQ